MNDNLNERLNERADRNETANDAAQKTAKKDTGVDASRENTNSEEANNEKSLHEERLDTWKKRPLWARTCLAFFSIVLIGTLLATMILMFDFNTQRSGPILQKLVLSFLAAAIGYLIIFLWPTTARQRKI